MATPQSSDSFILRFSELTEESETRPRDAALRAFDITLSAFFLLVLLPLTVPIALLLLLTSGRPLFYRGERVGRGGHVFEMLKLRTLRENAEERLGPYLGEELVQRTREETTAIGGWLRATQLDEIPQLWNVVRGDMSLVGPRPIRPRFFAELVEELPAYWQRLVVQGLTLPLVIRMFGIEADHLDEKEDAKARIKAADAALARLEELTGEEWVRDDTAERLRGLYGFRRDRFSSRFDRDDDGSIEERSLNYQRLRRELLEAERSEIVDLRRRGVISGDVERRLQRDLDLEDARLDV